MGIFPFKDKTVSSVRLTVGGSTEIFSHDGDEARPLDDPQVEGPWIVEKPRENEIVELLALLAEDARLYVDANWGSKTERMLVAVLGVNGEVSETWVEFT
jgi:hypothetical protein